MSIGRQISAARGLLRWSAAALAEKAGLTRDTINKIEADDVQPREGTVTDIIRVFNDHGVEFTDNSGVRLKPHGIEVLIGQKGLHDFFDGVYEYTSKHGGEIVQFGVDEHTFLTHLGNEYSAHHVKRMTQLAEDRKDIKVRAIICEGETEYLATEYNDYHWISKDIFAAVPFYICGETLAIMDFQTVPAPTILLLKFQPITNAYRKQFEAFWKMSQQMPAASPKKTKGK